MENNEAEKEFKKVLALAEDIKEMESIDVQGAFNRVHLQMKKSQHKKWMNKWMKYAAMLTLPFMLISILLGYLYFRKQDTTVQYAEVNATAGSVIRYELPDHSVVWLNAGTTLRYPTTFQSDRRDVELDGEAYFEVTADKEHPFYVSTHNGPTVYVYGTKFNVTAYSDDSYVGTVLEQGNVNVILPASEKVSLMPSEQLFYDKKNGTWTKSKVDVYEKVAWKDGKLIFRNATLEEIFKRLSRHFNVEIQLNNKKHKEYRYRATFRKETLSQILDYLSKSATMKWKIEDSVQQTDDTLTKTKYIVDLY